MEGTYKLGIFIIYVTQTLITDAVIFKMVDFDVQRILIQKSKYVDKNYWLHITLVDGENGLRYYQTAPVNELEYRNLYFSPFLQTYRTIGSIPGLLMVFQKFTRHSLSFEN